MTNENKKLINKALDDISYKLGAFTGLLYRILADDNETQTKSDFEKNVLINFKEGKLIYERKDKK